MTFFEIFRKIKQNQFGTEKKLTKTQIKINDTIDKLGIEPTPTS